MKFLSYLVEDAKAQSKYKKSAKGKATEKRYHTSGKGTEARKRVMQNYRDSGGYSEAKRKHDEKYAVHKSTAKMIQHAFDGGDDSTI